MRSPTKSFWLPQVDSFASTPRKRPLGASRGWKNYRRRLRELVQLQPEERVIVSGFIDTRIGVATLALASGTHLRFPYELGPASTAPLNCARFWLAQRALRK